MTKRMMARAAAALLAAALIAGCGYAMKGNGAAGLYGHIYNGLTRVMLTGGPSGNTPELAGTLVYYGNGKEMQTIDAEFTADGFFFFRDIPTDTPFIVTLTDADRFLEWFYESDTGIPDNTVDTITTPVYERDSVMLGNAYLFPSDLNAGDVTIEVYDASSGATIASAGSVLLRPGASLALLNNDATNELPNGAYARAPKVEGTLDAGAVTIAGTNLVLGLTYTVEVYGVTGYRASTSGGPVSANTQDAQTVRVPLTDVILALTVVARSDYDALGQQTVSGGTVTLTFNRDVELGPYVGYLAEIQSITAPDTDTDATTSVLAGFTGDPSAPADSNHLVVTASANQLTIAVKDGYLSTDDAEDALSVRLDLTTITVREAGSVDAFTDVETILAGTSWPTDFIVVRSF